MTNLPEPPNQVTLLPCPFCGCAVEQTHMDIVCTGCSAITVFSICSVDSHARRLWNTRITSTPDCLLLDELEDAAMEGCACDAIPLEEFRRIVKKHMGDASTRKDQERGNAVAAKSPTNMNGISPTVTCDPVYLANLQQREISGVALDVQQFKDKIHGYAKEHADGMKVLLAPDQPDDCATAFDIAKSGLEMPLYQAAYNPFIKTSLDCESYAREWFTRGWNARPMREAGGAWQPIETAPTSQHLALTDKGDVIITSCGGRGHYFNFKCTHWMPFPAAPSTTRIEGQS